VFRYVYGPERNGVTVCGFPAFDGSVRRRWISVRQTSDLDAAAARARAVALLAAADEVERG
jgi:hypothetical protein